MLEALTQIDRKSAGAALSSAMLIALGIGDVSNSTDSDQLTARILEEAREVSGFGQDDDSREALDAIRRLLSREADLFIFRDQTREGALDRLGDRGDLPNSAFKVRFHESFNHDTARSSHAQRAVLEASDVHHFIDSRDEDQRRFSLFVQKHYGKKGNIEHYNLVMSIREKQIITVTKLWRLNPNLVDVSDETPVGLLTSFVNRYGLSLLIANHPVQDRLVLDKKFPTKKGVPPIMVPGRVPSSSFSIDALCAFDVDQGALEVAFAYAIDIDRYKSDLRRAGQNRA